MPARTVNLAKIVGISRRKTKIATNIMYPARALVRIMRSCSSTVLDEAENRSKFNTLSRKVLDSIVLRITLDRPRHITATTCWYKEVAYQFLYMMCITPVIYAAKKYAFCSQKLVLLCGLSLCECRLPTPVRWRPHSGTLIISLITVSEGSGCESPCTAYPQLWLLARIIVHKIGFTCARKRLLHLLRLRLSLLSPGCLSICCKYC